LRHSIAEWVEGARERAAALDRSAQFPREDLDILTGLGLLSAPLPAALGGMGAGCGGSGAADLLHLLHRLGEGNLSVGRVFEAHVNALRLLMRYGTSAQQAKAAHDIGAGALFGLWVTDSVSNPLRMDVEGNSVVLTGQKHFCSAAGHTTHALVTAADGDGAARMLLVAMGAGETVAPLDAGLTGMRAAITGQVRFRGTRISTEAILGTAGDYLREPEFSVGAWRSAAVALGGLSALLEAARSQLSARGRAGDPHQRARMGRAFIAYQGGWLWMERVARMIADPDIAPEETVAYVNLARIAVEAACLEAMELVQRSLGLAAFLQSNPVERLCRDLATYLRQPAPDEALDAGAAFYMDHALPGIRP
jgi:alkylation response protein AidB-like acyl-CoA dehydrogenase